MAGEWKHRNVAANAPRLRILLDAVYVQVANLHSSSTYNKYVSLVKELVKRGHYVYWMLPDVEYNPNEIENHPNVGIIRTAYIQDQFIVDGILTDDFFNMFNRIAGRYHIDLICTSRTGAAGAMKRSLESPRFHDKGTDFTDKHYGLPMVVIEEFPQTPKRSHVGETYWLMQCMGYMAADGTVFISDHNRTEVTEGMQGIFTNSKISKFVEKTMIVPSGIEIAELDKIYEPDRWKVESGFRVLSVGRIMGVSYRDHLAWFDYIYKAGIDAKLIVSLSGGLGGPMRKALEKIGVIFDEHHPQYQIIENNPRNSFLRLLRTVHCGIAPMSHLDCPVGLSEAIYMGVPCIMPEADYQKTFFPDYPYVIKPSDKAALLMHLKDIKEDPEEARRKIEPWRQQMRTTFNAPQNIAVLCDYLEQKAREPLDRFKTSGAILQFLSELKGDRYSIGDVVEYLRECGNMGISIGNLDIRATWTYGRGVINHSMRYSGYIDLCDGPLETFLRKDKFDALQSTASKPKPKLMRKPNANRKAQAR